MHRISWKDRYNINYKNIDDQHRGLFNILNELMDLQDHEDDADRIAAIFHRLCQYALTHFTTEERYLKSAGYAELASHQAEHAYFIQQLLELNQSFEPGDPQLAVSVFTFIRDWYLRHILQTDRDYVATVKGYYSRADIRGIIFELEAIREVEEPHSGQPGTEPGHKGISVKEPILAVIQTLKPRFKLGLSTTPEQLGQGFDPGFQQWFDAIGTLGRGTSADMFQSILDDLDLMAEECIYVSAKPSDALAATNQLLHGIAAENMESLFSVFRRLKVDY
jgi:hemerythrin-like metal-binding protein